MESLSIEKKKLLDYQTLLKLTFEELSKYIRNNENIENIKLFLNNLMKTLNLKLRFNNKTVKVFLTVYLFVFHNDIVVQSKDDFNQKMITLSNELVLMFEKLFNNYSLNNSLKFEKDFNNYLNFFNEWKRRDSLIIIRPILKSYFELELLMNEFKKNNNNDYLYIERKLRSLKNNIKMIAGDDGLEYLNKRQIPVFKNEKMYTDVEKTVHKAFWDVFQENIENNKLDQITKFLSEVKEMIHEMIENKNFLKEFDENVDISIIENVMKSNQPEQLVLFMFTFIKYLTSLLYKLQPPSEDKNTKLFEENLEKMFSDNKKNSEILRYFFENYFKKLEVIKKVTLYIKKNMNVQKTKIEEI